MICRSAGGQSSWQKQGHDSTTNIIAAKRISFISLMLLVYLLNASPVCVQSKWRACLMQMPYCPCWKKVASLCSTLR